MNKEEMIHKLSQYDSENFHMEEFYDLFRFGIEGYEYMSEDKLKDIYKTIFEQSTQENNET